MQTLDELDKELQKEKFRPVYLVLGPEQWLCQKAIQLLKSRAVNAEGMAFDYSEFVAGEAPVDEIMEAANTFPMVSKRRLVLVTKVEKLKDSDQDALIESVKSISPRGMLVLSADELDHRKRFYKTLREEACVAEFSKLKGPALGQWAEALLKKQGHTVSHDALSRIVDLAGSDLQNLAMELEKLILYAGASRNIPDSAVDDLVRGSKQQSIFDLINAIGSRNRSEALKSLANLLGMGEHPFVVITMMARHCRQVLIAQDLLTRGSAPQEIGAAAQIPPFLLNQFLRQARSADPDRIRRMFVQLADIDKRLKSSSADGRLLLENLICAFV